MSLQAREDWIVVLLVCLLMVLGVLVFPVLKLMKAVSEPIPIEIAMDLEYSMILEFFKACLNLIVLVFGWFFGQRVIAYWHSIKKQRELDFATATQFHKLYGEFRAVSRLWRAYKHPKKKLAYTHRMPVELLKRAAAAEGELEGIIVKLAVEKNLNGEEKKSLGLFRQAYQKLREAIRNDEKFLWTRGTTEYQLFNDLASKTAYIIFSKKSAQHCESEAALSFNEIVDVSPKYWENEVKNLVEATEKNR